MAIDVSFFTFEKDSNSTATPAPTAGVVQSCLLREPCSILNPVLQLDITAMGATSPAAINYCHIPAFGRYYWVNDWTFERGFWVASCSVDALASWKTDIGNSTQYVVRSANQFNGDVPDMLYPANSTPIYSKTAEEIANYPFTNNITQGFYLVGIVNNDDNAVGTTAYYAFTNANFREFCRLMFSSVMLDNMNISDISSNLQKALVDPSQYVTTAVWIPVKDFPSGTDVTALKIGWWILNGVTARKLSSLVALKVINITGIAQHPQIAERGTFLEVAPFTRRKLVFPAFGMFELPSEWMVGKTGLTVSVLIDYVSGAGKLILEPTGGGVEQAVYNVQVGVPVSLHAVQSDVIGVGGSIAQSVASILSGNVLGAVSGIGNALSAISPTVTAVSNNGTFNGHFYNAFVVSEFHTVTNESRETIGRPYCGTAKINTLGRNQTHSGYMLCSNVELEIPCTPGEHDMIVSAMESGFYYV